MFANLPSSTFNLIRWNGKAWTWKALLLKCPHRALSASENTVPWQPPQSSHHPSISKIQLKCPLYPCIGAWYNWSLYSYSLHMYGPSLLNYKWLEDRHYPVIVLIAAAPEQGSMCMRHSEKFLNNWITVIAAGLGSTRQTEHTQVYRGMSLFL